MALSYFKNLFERKLLFCVLFLVACCGLRKLCNWYGKISLRCEKIITIKNLVSDALKYRLHYSVSLITQARTLISLVVEGQLLFLLSYD